MPSVEGAWTLKEPSVWLSGNGSRIPFISDRDTLHISFGEIQALDLTIRKFWFAFMK